MKIRLYLLGGAMLMLIAGIIAIVVHVDTFVELSWVYGIFILLYGILNVFIFIYGGYGIYGSEMILSEGIISILLSIFLLFHNMTFDEVIPFFFGVWEVFLGTLRLVHSIELFTLKIKDARLYCLVGLIEIASGMLFLLKPISGISWDIKVGVILCIQCLTSAFQAWRINHLVKPDKAAETEVWEDC